MSTPPTPCLLLTNDDGIHSPALSALAEALAVVGDVVVVAPETEQSSVSHAITLGRPLRLRPLHDPPRRGTGSITRWALDGTPADCTYVALHHPTLLPRPADLVVSGINLGSNLGTDVFYSGTVAGAREAALRGVSAVAFSMPSEADPRACARRAAAMVRRLWAWKLAHPRAHPVLLNVNFPRHKPRGTRVATLGPRDYENVVEVRNDPRGRQYLWIGGPSRDQPTPAGTDTAAFAAGYTAVTALRLDLTHADAQQVARAVLPPRRAATTP
jgi:5'-nucleotidase